MAKQRLQRILAAAGVASRRKCEQMILDGEVQVNGRVVDTLPVFADPEKDKITVNGQKIRNVQLVYFMLHKPKGVLCTNFDPDRRTLAVDLIRSHCRVHCVGRLDMDSSGLIILTNDNDLTNRLTHPKYEMPKTYEVEVKGRITDEMKDKLEKGVWLAEGKTKGSAVKVLHRGRDTTFLGITIKQGLNRQIRRMLAKLELDVKTLKRTRIGRLELKGLGVGRFRPLKPAEVAYLKKKTGAALDL